MAEFFIEKIEVCKGLFNASLALEGDSDSLAQSLEIARATTEGESVCKLGAREDGSFFCDRFIPPCPLRSIVEIR